MQVDIKMVSREEAVSGVVEAILFGDVGAGGTQLTRVGPVVIPPHGMKLERKPVKYSKELLIQIIKDNLDQAGVFFQVRQYAERIPRGWKTISWGGKFWFSQRYDFIPSRSPVAALVRLPRGFRASKS